MIDHVTVAVSDVEQSKYFYEKAFRPLGYIDRFGLLGRRYGENRFVDR